MSEVDRAERVLSGVNVGAAILKRGLESKC